MKNCILCLFLLLPTIFYAQLPDVKIETGEKQKKGLTQGNLGIIATTDDGFYALRLKSKGIVLGIVPIGLKGQLFLDFYDNNLNLKKEIEVKDVQYTIYNKVKKSFEFFIQDKEDNIYMYYSSAEKDFTYLYRKKLNTRTNKFDKEEMVSKAKSSKKNSLDRRGTYGAFPSPDNSKTAIVSFASINKEESDILFVEVLNNKDLSTIWKKEFTLNVKGYKNHAKNAYLKRINPSIEYQNVYPIKLSNKGVLSFLFKEFDEESGGIFKAKDYSYQLFSASPKGVKKKILKTKGKHILQATIKHDSNGNIKCGGYFSDDKKTRNYTSDRSRFSNDRRVGDYDGVIFYEFDGTSLNLIDQSIISFNKEQKKKFLISSDDDSKRNERRAKKLDKKLKKGKNVNIYNHILRDIVSHSNNSLTLISESYKKVVRKTTDKDGNTTTTITYYFGDMVFIHLNDAGEVEWIKNVEKNQVGTNYAVLGVKLFYAKDKIFFLYNNILGRKGSLNLGMMDKSGNYKNEELTEISRKGEMKKMFISPTSFRKINGNQVVGFANRVLKSKIVKLTLVGIDIEEEAEEPIVKAKKQRPKEKEMNSEKREVSTKEGKKLNTESKEKAKEKIAVIEKQLKELSKEEVSVDELENLSDEELEKQLKISELKERLEKIKLLEEQLDDM